MGVDMPTVGLYGPEGVRYASGRPAVGLSVAVLDSFGQPAVLYTDNTGNTSTGTNITEVDGNGNVSFWAVPGFYSYTVAGVSIPAVVQGVGGGGGGGIVASVKPRYIQTGNITPPADGAWTPVSGFEIAIPASVGDWVELTANFMIQPNSISLFDFATVVGSTPQRFFASGGASPGFEGNPGMYPQTSFRPFNGVWGFQVAVSDRDGTNVRLCLVHKGAASGTVFADNNYPFYWCARVTTGLSVL